MARKKTEIVNPEVSSAEVVMTEKEASQIEKLQDIEVIEPEIVEPSEGEIVEPENVIPEDTEEEIPDYAKRVLAMFPEHQKLYVTRNGGAFPASTNPRLRGSAILYKNPYYKS